MTEQTNHPAPEPGRPKLEWVVVFGEMHHVSDFAHLPPPDRPAALCPVCEEGLVLKLGEKLAHHAAHHSGSACSANDDADEVNERFRRANEDTNHNDAPFALLDNSIARVILMGNVGAVPDVVYVAGERIARFRLATHRGRKTDWHSVLARGALTRLAETQIRTGTHLTLSGDITHRRYLDRTGTARWVTEIDAHDIILS